MFTITRQPYAYVVATLFAVAMFLSIAFPAHALMVRPSATIQKFTASPANVLEGSKTKLSWSTVGTSNCNLFDVTVAKRTPNLVQPELKTTGSYSVDPFGKYKVGTIVTYRLRCQDASTQKDRVVEKDVKVTLKARPKAAITSFIATPAVIRSGTSKLIWESVGTSNCSVFDVTNPKANPNLTQSELKPNGSLVVYPLEKYNSGTKVSYLLRCQDASTQKDRVVEKDVQIVTIPVYKVLGASTSDLEAVLQSAIDSLREIMAQLQK